MCVCVCVCVQCSVHYIQNVIIALRITNITIMCKVAELIIYNEVVFYVSGEICVWKFYL